MLYLRWVGSQGDYLSYIRGKSNVVQVFDTMTDTVWAQKQYQLDSPIKGLGTLGKDVFELRHVLVTEKGRMIVDKVNDKKFIAEWQLPLLTGSKVTCSLQNPHSNNQVAVGCKDTLLQLWDLAKDKKPLWQARNLPNDELDL